MILKESPLAQQVTVNIKGDAKIDWAADWVDLLFKLITESMAVYLGEVKGDTPKAIKLVTEDEKTTLFAAVIEKNKSEAGEGYSLTYGFNDDIIPEDAEVVNTDDPVYSKLFDTFAMQKFHMRFASINGRRFGTVIMRVAVKSMVEYMRANVGIDPVIEIPEYFKVEASIEDNAMHLKFTPSEVLKQHIKDDASITQ